MIPEGKPQSLFVPLRMRFRPPVELLASESVPPLEEAVAVLPEPALDDEPTAPSLPVIRHASLQQNRQIKELIRLGNVLRAELRFDEVLEQVISSINSCLG